MSGTSIIAQIVTSLSVKRSDKKNAPHLKRQEKLLHFKCQEKRQEKCWTHFKCLEKRQEKCATFEVSRKATRKWPEFFFIIWNLPVKKN